MARDHHGVAVFFDLARQIADGVHGVEQVVAPGSCAVYREEGGIDAACLEAGNVQLNALSQRIGVLTQVSDGAGMPRAFPPLTLAVQPEVSPSDVGDGAVVVGVDDDSAAVELACCFLVHR